jgi:anaerobic nitric oxide reductase transcription regulator
MTDPVLEIATVICEAVHSQDRYVRIAEAVRAAVGADSAAILCLRERSLVTMAGAGLRPEAVLRVYEVAEHPRFDRILKAGGVIRFRERDLADPFDGLIAATPDGHIGDVHACMGAPLVVRGEIIGVLAMDALAPDRFDSITDQRVARLTALVAAAVQSSVLLEEAQTRAAHSDEVMRQSWRETIARTGPEILGTSGAIHRLREEVAISAASDLNILITGETGVGKEIVAQTIHSHSPRRKKPLVHVNCAALPESIVESELFGHVRGAFTGATDSRMGKFELADGGTLFLDEVGELPLSVQPKLLRVLQQGEIQRVGSDKTHRVNVRLVAATNRDLAEEVNAGRFRADLYHRLSVVPVRVPTLRERGDDVLLLAGFFLDQARSRLGAGPVRLTPDAREALLAYPWPGNVRELEHVLLRATLHASGGHRHTPVTVDDAHLSLPRLPSPIDTPRAGQRDTGQSRNDSHEDAPVRCLREEVNALERRLIAAALGSANGNWAEAARRLKVDRANLHRMARRLGIGPSAN